jgi:hypothetical protein
MNEIWQILESQSESESWMDLYEWDKRFKFLCDRTLELNGIDPDWLTPGMIQAMLFTREEKGEIRSGWLLEINRPVQGKGRGKDKDKNPATLAHALAAIATQTEDLRKALDLADTIPAKDLQAVLSELAELRQAQAEPEKAQRKKNQAKARANIEKLRVDNNGSANHAEH